MSLSVGLFSRKTSKQEDAQVLKAQDAKEKVKWSKRPASECTKYSSRLYQRTRQPPCRVYTLCLAEFPRWTARCIPTRRVHSSPLPMADRYSLTPSLARLTYRSLYRHCIQAATIESLATHSHPENSLAYILLGRINLCTTRRYTTMGQQQGECTQ